MKQFALALLLTIINPPPRHAIPTDTWIIWSGSTYQIVGRPEWDGNEWVYQISSGWGLWEMGEGSIRREHREHWGKVWKSRWGK